jgi:membrane protein
MGSRVKTAAQRMAGALGAALSRYFSSGAPDFAAGIAYRVLFSLAPLLVLLVSVFGLFLQNQELKDDVITAVVSALPFKTANVTKAIENIATPASAAGLVSLVVLVWAASGMITSLRFGLERTMGIEETRGVVRGKAFDLALVSATALLVLASVGVGLVTQLVDSLVSDVARLVGVQGDTAKGIVSKVFPLLLWTGTLLLVYRLIPSKRPRFGDALAGAVLAALLLLVLSLAAGLFYAHATKWSFVYGSLTSVFVFLYSVYLFASVVLFGGAFTTEWSRPHPPNPEPLGVRLRRAIRGVFHRSGRSSARR